MPEALKHCCFYTSYQACSNSSIHFVVDGAAMDRRHDSITFCTTRHACFLFVTTRNMQRNLTDCYETNHEHNVKGNHTRDLRCRYNLSISEKNTPPLKSYY
jgi:hypothetical protein